MLNKKNISILYLSLLLCTKAIAQDIAFARKIVNDLCAPEMFGRGYVNKGQQLAAAYIKTEFGAANVKPFKDGYEQFFGFQAIAFPYNIDIKFDDKDLVVGEDVIVSSGCPQTKGVFSVFWIDSSTIDNPQEFKEFERTPFYKTFLVVDAIKGKKLNNATAAQKILDNGYKAKGLIYANQTKLTASVSMDWDSYPILYIVKGAINRYQRNLKLDIQSEANDYGVQNIAGYIKGTQYPDSFIVITAHYDHLGKMGNYALFPGANDNASGVAMMLDLMKTIQRKPLPYSVAFIAFAAEEIGLLGSLYYTENPLFPLQQISMLINLDLMGTGDKGMTVVNATLFPEEFQDLQLINLNGNYLPTVNPRGKAANSDHHYFTEKGVKAFYFYLMGEYKYYHDVNDTPSALTLSKYNEAFSLIYQFIREYSTAKE